MVASIIDNVVPRGFKWGIVGALLGSLIFGLTASPLILWETSQIPFPSQPIPHTPVELIEGYLQGGPVGILRGVEDLLASVMLGGTIGFLCSAIPGALGGILLGILIHLGAVRLHFPGSIGVAVTVGALVGGATGRVLVTPLAWLPPPDSAELILERLVLLAATASGAWVGWRLVSGYRHTAGEKQLALVPSSICEELPILRSLLRGLGWGLIACLLFSVIFDAMGILSLGMSPVDGIFVLVMSLVPAMWGGAIFGILLYNVFRMPLSTSSDVLLISIIGGVLAFLIAEPTVLLVIGLSHTQSMVPRVIQVGLGFLTGAVIRILAEKRLASEAYSIGANGR